MMDDHRGPRVFSTPFTMGVNCIFIHTNNNLNYTPGNGHFVFASEMGHKLWILICPGFSLKVVDLPPYRHKTPWNVSKEVPKVIKILTIKHQWLKEMSAEFLKDKKLVKTCWWVKHS